MPKTKRKSAVCKPKRVVKYKSKFEKKVSELLEANHIPAEYEASVLPYSLHLDYKPDWKVDDGLYLEAKGKFDYVERRKMAAVLDAHPDKEIRMVFMRNQRLGKGSKMTYLDWCAKYGIKATVYPELPL